MFIRHEKLNPRNCAVQSVRFVKSITRRPKLANVWLADDVIIEVKIHTYNDNRARKYWDNRESFEIKQRCYGYCSSSHITIFIKNEKLYRLVRSEIKEFENPWLLNHIMKNVFKGQTNAH